VYPPLVMSGGPQDVREDCAIGWQDAEAAAAPSRDNP
jgi:hypothetical protein